MGIQKYFFGPKILFSNKTYGSACRKLHFNTTLYCLEYRWIGLLTSVGINICTETRGLLGLSSNKDLLLQIFKFLIINFKINFIHISYFMASNNWDTRTIIKSATIPFKSSLSRVFVILLRSV
jgi:hypothetical protein